MFGFIKTENLCLIEISTIIKIKYIDEDTDRCYFSQNKRYTLAYKYNDQFTDVFTNTKYEDINNISSTGFEGVSSSKNIITNKKYLTGGEALYILQSCNPTYLPKETKILKKSKKCK